MAYIKDKDQKMLWGRSAGMCSWCKAKLTIDDGAGDPATVGAMCHIVGEKDGSARYNSNLTDDERNSYSNLILMCSHHHDIIDKDDKIHTIEKLHILKNDHEVWVAETLGNQNPDPDEMVYSNLIDTITIMLKLEQWSWFVDHAVRNLVHHDFVDAQGVLNKKLLGTIWPENKPELKDAIVELLNAFDKFMVNYLSNAELRDNFFGRNLTYKRIYPNPDYYKYKEKEDRWADINFWLLCDYTNKLNNYASAVRQFSNPLYFRIVGKFLIEDEMGHRFGGINTIFDPVNEDVVKKLDELGYKIE
ncbi:MAG: hypothetical protein U9N34_03605 [Candidatus Cloacimonadota bacterium]|nr:hypothetical protein [Candidatus Cloacimonadota bacterium]